MSLFLPRCLPMLIGSLPHSHHRQAVEAVFTFTPELPCWPQLPNLPGEDMISQFLPQKKNGHGAEEKWQAKGFALFLQRVKERREGENEAPFKVKGQVTGPLTLLFMALRQTTSSPIQEMADSFSGHIADIAACQVKQLKNITPLPIIMIDEPLLSTAPLARGPLTHLQINKMIARVILAIRQSGGLAGIHVCNRPSWQTLFELAPDIISFDSYHAKEGFAECGKFFCKFCQEGGILAHGLIPSTRKRLADTATEKLADSFFAAIKLLEQSGLDRQTIFQQTIITPACGLAGLSMKQAEGALLLLQDVSTRLQDYFERERITA